MDNLNTLGVQEMDANESKSINGGLAPILAVLGGIVTVAAAAYVIGYGAGAATAKIEKIIND